jgi:hypothetical protein
MLDGSRLPHGHICEKASSDVVGESHMRLVLTGRRGTGLTAGRAGLHVLCAVAVGTRLC